jgi:hypothetical protein
MWSAVNGRSIARRTRRRTQKESGEVSCLPAGHDAWVVGNEPVVLVDWFGATHYAEKK